MLAIFYLFNNHLWALHKLLSGARGTPEQANIHREEVLPCTVKPVPLCMTLCGLERLGNGGESQAAGMGNGGANSVQLWPAGRNAVIPPWNRGMQQAACNLKLATSSRKRYPRRLGLTSARVWGCASKGAHTHGSSSSSSICGQSAKLGRGRCGKLVLFSKLPSSSRPYDNPCRHPTFMSDIRAVACMMPATPAGLLEI